MASNYEGLKLEGSLSITLHKLAGERNQHRGTFIQYCLIKTCEKELRKAWGDMEYERLLEKYSMTLMEQQKLKTERALEKAEKERQKLELMKKRINQKDRELTIREANSGIRIDKHNGSVEEEITELTRLRESYQKNLDDPNTNSTLKEVRRQQIEKLDAQITELKGQSSL